jgi:hypothetical protein
MQSQIEATVLAQEKDKAPKKKQKLVLLKTWVSYSLP